MNQAFRSGTSIEFRHFAAGFTLIELLVVLLILVMAAAAIPLALDHVLPSRRLEAATENLRSRIQRLETRSVLENRPLQESLAALQHSIGTDVTAQMTDDLGTPISVLQVYPDGSTSGVRVIVQSAARRVSIYVSGISGRVAVEKSP